MDLRQLATFREVAKTLSFTRAANNLNYVQSTITAQIQALETELGVPLFDRLGKRIALTDAGQRLLHYADQVLALIDEAQIMVASGEEPAGKLVFGAAESLCIYRLPPILRQFRNRFPRVKVLFQPGSCAEVRQRISSGEIDVAFVMEECALEIADLNSEPLVDEQILLIAPPDHPLAHLPRVTAADLAGEQVVLTEGGCSYRQRFEQALDTAGVRPTDQLEFSNVEAIKQCVIAGLGVGVLPAFVVAQELANGQLVALPWDDQPMRMVTQLIWHRDKWLSPALTAFLQVTREIVYDPHSIWALPQPLPGLRLHLPA